MQSSVSKYGKQAVEIRRRLHAADPQEWKPESALRSYQSALTTIAGFDPPNLTRAQATRTHSYLGIGRLAAETRRQDGSMCRF